MKELNDLTYFNGVNDKSFWKTITRERIGKVFFHNLSWDGEFIIHSLIENGYVPNNDPQIKKAPPLEFTMVKDDRGTIYQIKVTHANGKTTTFRDTARLLLSSVSKMGDEMGFPKGEYDYSKIREYIDVDDAPSELIEYMERDIDIVIKAYSEYKTHYPKHGYTTAGTALKSFKEYYGQYEYVKDFGGSYTSKSGKTFEYNHLTKEQWLKFKMAYKGGLTIGNELTRNRHLTFIDGHSVDVNSLYPFIMATKKMPYGKPLKYKPDGSYVEIIYIHISHTIKKDLEMPNHLHNPKAGLLSKNKYLEMAENITCAYLKEELDELKLTYDLVEDINYYVLERWFFKTKFIFTEWINEMSLLKINAKSKTERNSHKTTQNGLYGKFGENFMKKRAVLVYDPKKLLIGNRYGDYVEQKEVYEKEQLSYIPIAICITAYSRIHLLQAIRLNKHSFLYGDTDSLYLSQAPIGLKLDESEYGAFKPELRFSEFKWIKPKAYIAKVTHEFKNNQWIETDEIKRAIAGLTKESHHLVSFDNFKPNAVIANGKRQKKKVKGGVVLHDITYTL